MEDALITCAVLEDLAGSTAFRRGEGYFSVGAVERLRVTDDEIAARVEGTETYQAEPRDDDGDLAYGCTCLRAADGYFCRHCVAAGLAWLAEHSTASTPASASGKKKWRDIEKYLITQPPEALIELLVAVAQRDGRLYQSLLLKAERTGGSGNAVKAYQRAIDGATRIHCVVDWREAATFAGNIDQLAERLFRRETTLPFGLCSFDANTYRNILGKVGLRRDRELAEAEWHKIKPRGSQDGYDAHRSRITRIMEQLAEASGDVEELVAIKSRDLSSCYRYLEIAEIWAEAKQPDKALESAERGLKAFPERPDNRLRDFLVAAYLRVMPPIVEQTNNAAYAEAIKLIRKVGGLMKMQKQPSPFGDYLAELRAQFKRKRNFIKLLDGVARSAAN